jgi:hypothetical protein
MPTSKNALTLEEMTSLVSVLMTEKELVTLEKPEFDGDAVAKDNLGKYHG